jgi:[calcium/calmodulin-dependent protein kinase] kinase
MLQRPGIVHHPDSFPADDTPETLTPPALSKHTSSDVETSHVEDDAIVLSPDEDEEGYNGDGDTTFNVDDDDSDSDEGLTMSRKKPKPKSQSPVDDKRGFQKLERRGTNASVGSTETAKKVIMES